MEDIIKKANKVIHEGITLMNDEMKKDFLSNADKEKYINVAIESASAVADTDEKKTMLAAYAVQEANRVISELWREELLTAELETEYRALPKMKEMQAAYHKFEVERDDEANKIEEARKAFVEKDRSLSIFQGVVNGLAPEKAEEKYTAYQQQIQQAAQRR